MIPLILSLAVQPGNLPDFPVQILEKNIAPSLFPKSRSFNLDTRTGGKFEILRKSKKVKSKATDPEMPGALDDQSYDFELPAKSNVAWASLRKSMLDEITAWFSKANPGQVTQRFTIATPAFACVYRNTYFSEGSGSLSYSESRTWYYVKSGSNIYRISFKSLVKSERLSILNREFVLAIHKANTDSGVEANEQEDLLQLVTLEKNGFRVYFDMDRARGRFVSALVPFDRVIDHLRPNSPVASLLNKSGLENISLISQVPFPVSRKAVVKPEVWSQPRFEKVRIQLDPALERGAAWNTIKPYVFPTGEPRPETLPQSLRGLLSVSNGTLRLRNPDGFRIWQASAQAKADGYRIELTPIGFITTHSPDEVRFPENGTYIFRVRNSQYSDLLLEGSSKDTIGWRHWSMNSKSQVRILLFQESIGKTVDEYIYNGKHFTKGKTLSFTKFDDRTRESYGQAGYNGNSRSDDLDFDGIEELIIARANGEGGEELENLIFAQTGEQLTPISTESWASGKGSALNLAYEIICGSLGTLELVVKNIRAWGSADGEGHIHIGSLKAKDRLLEFPGRALLVDDLDGDLDNDILAIEQNKLYLYRQANQ